MKLVGKLKQAHRRRTKKDRDERALFAAGPDGLKAAQHFYLNIFSEAAKTGKPPRDYKAPHAYRGTPPRPKTSRSLRAPKRLFRAA